MAIDTGKVQGRRTVTFSSLQDVLADAERMSASNAKALGNWSAGQIFQHLAKVMDDSIDGSKLKVAWFIRLLAPLMKKRLLSGPMPPGFQLPAAAVAVLVPGPTSTEEGLAALRAAITRLERDPSRARNPVFGVLTHEEWNQLHLKHSALHLSFLVPQS